MDSLLKTIKEFCNAYGVDKTYWLACSGGLDSTVLLHLFFNIKKELALNIKVIHVNHSLNPHASEWASQVESLCKTLNFECFIKTIQAHHNPGESPEEVARDKRYEVFKEIIGENEILVLAHHEDDQAETFLLQLARGAGIKGLSCMPAFKKFGKGYLARPLLNFNREHLTHYAKQNSLTWINDDANTNLNFARNFIRHEIMTRLKTKWPSITKTISRSAAHCAQTQNILDSKVFTEENISASALLAQTKPDRDLHLRSWILKKGFKAPSQKQLNQIEKDILFAKKDKNPFVMWGDVVLKRYQDELFLESAKKISLQDSYSWDLTQALQLPIGQLQINLSKGEGLRADLENVTVRFRKGGEVIRFKNNKYTKELKKVFQEKKIAPWLRQSIPLIYVGEELAYVVGFGVAEKFAAKENEQGLVVNLI